MKLLAATVRSYRLHHDTTVEFDGSRTLIGGPNEAGKSTLIEAIHRGFFLKAKGTGLLHKSMVSTLHPGHPEVEIAFEAGGSAYRLRKRFSGQNGTTQLAEDGGQVWQGEDAEEKLAALLGSEDATGRATASKINDQWAHLWVWQGQSGTDPALHAETQQSELLQRLQESGGAVAMQSELDGKVASRFAKAREQLFVRGGNAKAGSDLDTAQAECNKAGPLHDAAAERLGALQQAIVEYETAEATLQRTAADLETLRTQQQAVRAKLAQAEELRQERREREGAAGAARSRLEALEAIETSLLALRGRRDELRAVLQPKQDELREAGSEIAALRKRAGLADREHQESQASTRDARRLRDLAAACVAVHEKRSRVVETGKRLDRVRALRSDIADHRRRLSELPEVDRACLEELQRIESELGQAKAALNAMAAEVEVVSAAEPIRVGGQPVEEGASRTIDESTEVRIGSSVCLRIHPGGGDSLSGARETLRALNGRLQSILDPQGLDSTQRVSDVVAAREDLLKRIDGVEATLAELDPEASDAAHAEAQDERTAAEAEVSRRLEAVSGFVVPETLPAARALRDAQDESVQTAEGDEGGLKAARDALQEHVAELEKKGAALREGIAEDQTALTGAEAQLTLLTESHGDDAARRVAMDDARRALADAEQQLAQTQRALEELQPELLATDRERLERSVQEANRQREDAQTARAVSQSLLRSDGSDDPKASLAQAEARWNAAREHLQSVKRKATAIALLDDLFQEQQQALADRFSRPLADKITGYLQCLFGPDARAAVRFEDNAFKAIELVRSSQAGTATAFEVLSGGTQEQVAAAVRLAIAELLAAEHDGTLPVVFDDAFAYSDPQRVHVVQRMLDLGAARGLQIIVLTCNPSDYAALGARQVLLAPAAAQVRPANETE